MALSNSQRLAITLESIQFHGGLYWYDVGGQTLFPCFSADGGLSSSYMAILIKTPPEGAVDFGKPGLHDENGGKWFCLSFTDPISAEQATREIDSAISQLVN